MCLHLTICSALFIAVDPNHPGYNGLGEVCYKRAKNNPTVSHISQNYVKTSNGKIIYHKHKTISCSKLNGFSI